MIYLLKVVFLTTSFPLYSESSSGVFVKNLIDNMPENISATVITPEDPEALKKTPASKQVRVEAFRYAPLRWEMLAHKPGGIPVALKRNRLSYLLIPFFLFSMFYKTIICAFRADLMHANWAICGYVAGMVGKIFGLPVVLTLRGEDVSRSKDSLTHRMILKMALNLSTVVVTVSDAFRHWLLLQYPEIAPKIMTIANGVDDDLLLLGKGRQKAIDKTRTHFVAIGSLIPRKGIDQIISAFSMIPESKKVFLDIIGSGPEEDTLKNQVATSGLSQRINFSGSVAPEDIPSILEQAEALILASHSEGRPNVVLEAMAAGLPVIGSDIEGVNELVTHERTGLLFHDGCIEELASHIQALADDGELRLQYGRNGHNDIVRRKLIWRQTALEYQKVYCSLVK